MKPTRRLDQWTGSRGTFVAIVLWVLASGCVGPSVCDAPGPSPARIIITYERNVSVSTVEEALEASGWSTTHSNGTLFGEKRLDNGSLPPAQRSISATYLEGEASPLILGSRWLVESDEEAVALLEAETELIQDALRPSLHITKTQDTPDALVLDPTEVREEVPAFAEALETAKAPQPSRGTSK